MLKDSSKLLAPRSVEPRAGTRLAVLASVRKWTWINNIYADVGHSNRNIPGARHIALAPRLRFMTVVPTPPCAIDSFYYNRTAYASPEIGGQLQP